MLSKYLNCRIYLRNQTLVKGAYLSFVLQCGGGPLHVLHSLMTSAEVPVMCKLLHLVAKYVYVVSGVCLPVEY